MNLPINGKPTPKDWERFVELHARGAEGYKPNDEEKLFLGRMAVHALDVVEIEDGTFKAALSTRISGGKLTKAETAELADAGAQLPSLETNQKLFAVLDRMKTTGKATDADIDEMIAAAGRLSTDEVGLLKIALVAMQSAQTLTKPQMERIDKWFGEEMQKKATHQQKWDFFAKVGQLGLIAATMLSMLWLNLHFAADFAKLGEMGSFAAHFGVSIGVIVGVRKLFGVVNRVFAKPAANYGVND